MKHISAVIVLSFFFPVALIAESIQVGALLPLSGPAAEGGTRSKRGLELAKERIEEEFGLSIELLLEDTRAEPRRAVDAYRKLLFTAKPKVVISWGSGVGLALSPLVNKDKVIQIGVATASPKYASHGDYNFRTYPSSDYEGREVARVVFDTLQAKRVAIVQVENDYGAGAAGAFLRAAEAKEKKVITHEIVFPEADDFRTVLLNVLKRKPDLVYLAVYPREGAVLLKQLRELNYRGRIVATPDHNGDAKASYSIQVFLKGEFQSFNR